MHRKIKHMQYKINQRYNQIKPQNNKIQPKRPNKKERNKIKVKYIEHLID